MSCVEHAINMVCNSDIDQYLLELAFTNPNGNFGGNWYNSVDQNTVEQGIREKVIHAFVLPSCQINGGKTEFIDLYGTRVRDMGNGCIECKVPLLITGGRHIVHVIEVYLGSLNSITGVLGLNQSGSACGGGVLNEMTSNLLDSLDSSRSIPQSYTNIHMNGNNSFVIFGMTNPLFSMCAKVILEYDDNLSVITPRAWDVFGDLCILATKAHIYKNCRRPTEEAVKRSGVALDSIRDDISEYRDAWKEYRELFQTRWTKLMSYSDLQRKASAVSSLTVRRM